MERLFLLILIVAIAWGSNSCTSPGDMKSTDQAQVIVDSAIAAVGGDLLLNAEISFRFRVRDYIYKNQGGEYEYTRIYIDTNATKTVDKLTNKGLRRWIDNAEVELDSSWRQRYTNSVNSVIYYAFLPYRLNDQAVIKTYRGLVDIKDKTYHEILVQFEQEGGGVDFEDNYLYWFDTADYSMDYFAYDYISDGGGVRFREAYNRREIEGVTIQDYVNYKPPADSVGLYEMLDAFKQNDLVELSKIELEGVKVDLTN